VKQQLAAPQALHEDPLPVVPEVEEAECVDELDTLLLVKLVAFVDDVAFVDELAFVDVVTVAAVGEFAPQFPVGESAPFEQV